MSREDKWRAVQAKIQEIRKINIEPAIAESGAFSRHAPIFRGIIGMLDLVNNINAVPPFPESTLAPLLSELLTLEKRLSHCAEYNLRNSVSEARNQEEIKQIVGNLEHIWANLLPQILMVRSAVPFGEADLSAFHEKSTKILREITDTKDQEQQILEHIQKVSKDLIKKAEMVAVADYVKHFNFARIGYLIVAIFCLSVAVFLGYEIYEYSQQFLYEKADAQNWQQFLEHYMPRIVPMIVLLSFLFFALKQFQSAMHNVAAYLHRKIIMQTFQAFRDSAAEPAVKDQILLHAVKNAMDQTKTGYLAGDIDQQNFTPVGELKNTVTGGKP